ncbi:MAG: chromate resistance protein [Gammaproteobacteria bacterium]|nr:chromate resistance protein [Gammaproteobacteria bacterium]
MEKSPSPEAPWLLLIHQLPAEPSRARVKIWRRLQAVGAVAVKNSVYVLPRSDEALAEFEGLRAEIVALGGEALVLSATATDTQSSREIRDEIERARQRDWQELGERCRATLEAYRTHEPAGGDIVSELKRQATSLRARAARIDRVDPFRAAGRGEALADLERIENLMRPDAGATQRDGAPRSIADYRDRVWLTRPHPGVDRMASAWLIRRFVDPRARFVFSDSIAGQDDVVPFDMQGAGLDRSGERATFETLMREFGLNDPALARLARIVREIELGSEAPADAESPSVARLVHGLKSAFADDATLLEHGIALFAALYASFSASERSY